MAYPGAFEVRRQEYFRRIEEIRQAFELAETQGLHTTKFYEGAVQHLQIPSTTNQQPSQ